MRIYEPVAGIEGVSDGGTATAKIPTNRRLHMLRFFAVGTAAGPVTVYGSDVIDTVYIYVGGRLQRTITGAELGDISNLNGIVVDANGADQGLTMYFTEPWRASVMDEQVLAWDLWGVGDVTVKVKLKSVTAPTLAIVMVHDDGFTTNSQGQRVLNVVRHSPFNYNAGTQFDITTLDVDKPIQRIYIYPEAANAITAVKVTVNDSVVVHELTAVQNARQLNDYGLVYTPGDGVAYPLLFDIEQQVFNGLPAPKSLRVSVTQDGAGSLKAILENRAAAYV